MTPASGSRPERVDLTRLRWQILATTSAAAFAANVIGALLPDEAIIVDEANTAGLGLPALSAGNPGISCTATPAAGAGQSRGALGVGDEFALTVAAPAPVVERAGHLVALDGALG